MVKTSGPSLRQANEAANQPKSPKRVKTGLKRTIGATKRGIRKGASPFSFLLIPFKNRPMRFIGRILATVLLINYFRQSWKELRQVTWPDRKQTTQLTLAVFAFAIVFTIVIALVDLGLDKIFRKVFVK